jgi:hypothetical protein
VLGLVQLTACGFGNHTLQSITVHPDSASAAEHGGAVQFTATGHFDSVPLIVAPLPVDWEIDSPPWVASGSSEVSIDSDGVARCSAGAVGTHKVLAIAPADGNLQISSTGDNAVIGTAEITCP